MTLIQTINEKDVLGEAVGGGGRGGQEMWLGRLWRLVG